jgi:MoaA/NifB/PqqE/SkfB family radical SAM enzyme
MRIKNKIKAMKEMVQVKYFHKRTPLAVRWQLTNKCVSKCMYCDIWNIPMRELSLKDMRPILDEMGVLGVQAISFSGGEPMLRQDIGEIFEYTKRKGISTEMNSTGVNIPENIEKLKNLDFLKISLDGPEEINDLLRGKGSYGVAIEAAEAAKTNKIRFIFTTTLTKYNLNSIDFLISLSGKYNTLVAFQPFKDLFKVEKASAHLYPQAEEFKKAVSKLIAIKKSGNTHLRNSLLGLYHIYNWPRYNNLTCWAGKIFCIIETDGTLLPCDRISYNTKLPNCLEKGFIEALLSLPEVHCQGCGFCGTLELNFTMSLRLGAIKSILKVIK